MEKKLCPALEERFLPPEGWQEGQFDNLGSGHQIHYGFVAPDNPKAVAVVLPGLSEFAEIFYETTRDLLVRGIAVYIINWQYQGYSGRKRMNPHKRHSDGFEKDMCDVKKLLDDFITPAYPELPKIMVAHSTGGNIGLRYLAKHPDDFTAAAISAPLIGVYGFGWLPLRLWVFISGLLKPYYKCYVPGGKDWRAEARKSDGTDKFSSDPVRDKIHNAWCLTDTRLQSGNPTIGWLHEAFRSMRKLHKPKIYNAIKTPCLIAVAGKDKIVDSGKAIKLAGKIKSAELLYLENAKHEILLETDDIRMRFWDAFDKILAEQNILR